LTILATVDGLFIRQIVHPSRGITSSAIFTCIGALGTPPAERGPSLESINNKKIISFKKLFHHSQLAAPQKEKKSGAPEHVPSVPIG